MRFTRSRTAQFTNPNKLVVDVGGFDREHPTGLLTYIGVRNPTKKAFAGIFAFKATIDDVNYELQLPDTKELISEAPEDWDPESDESCEWAEREGPTRWFFDFSQYPLSPGDAGEFTVVFPLAMVSMRQRPRVHMVELHPED